MSRILKLGVKLGIVGGTVHYTNQSGLWSDSADTEQLYRDIYTTFLPLVEDVPVEIPEIPKAGDISRYLVDNWNAGVLHSSSFLAHLPTHVYNAGVKVNGWISEQTNPPTPSN